MVTDARAPGEVLGPGRHRLWPRGIIGAASARLQIGFLGRRSFGRVFELYAKGASQSHAEVGDDQGLPSTPSVGASSTLSPEAALNERMDYFGSTVNVAARLAGLSEGADVVMSDRVRKDSGVAALLASEDVVVEAFRSPLQGVEGEAMLWRVRASTESGPDEHSPSATGGDP